MKLKEALAKTVYRGALYYTLITAVMSALGILLSEDASVDILRPARFLLVLLFSYIAASVSVLRQSRRFSATASLIIHFLGFTLGFYLCLVLPSNLSFSPSFIIMVIFVILYAAATAFFTRLRRVRENGTTNGMTNNISSEKNFSYKKAGGSKTGNKPRKEKEEYTSQFGLNNTDSKKQ